MVWLRLMIVLLYKGKTSITIQQVLELHVFEICRFFSSADFKNLSKGETSITIQQVLELCGFEIHSFLAEQVFKNTCSPKLY